MKNQKQNNNLKPDKVEEPAISYTSSSPLSKVKPKIKTPPVGYMTSQQFRIELKAELKDFYTKNGLL